MEIPPITFDGMYHPTFTKRKKPNNFKEENPHGSLTKGDTFEKQIKPEDVVNIIFKW